MLDREDIAFLVLVNQLRQKGESLPAAQERRLRVLLEENADVPRLLSDLEDGDAMIEELSHFQSFQSTLVQDEQRVFRLRSHTAKIVALNASRKLLLIVLTVGVAAAIVFAMIGFPKMSSLPSHKENIASNNVPAPVNGATLLLSDGRTVMLDSTINGTIANQNGTEVNKKATGQLVYGFLGNKNNDFNTLTNTLTTARGKTFKVVLADGTKVFLNAGSTLTYFAGLGKKDTVRVVSLSGEGYFEVAPNKSAPFLVKVNEATVSVLGTHVDIMAYDDEENLETTLLVGSVKVSHGASQVILQPGQQARLSNKGSGSLKVAEVEAERYIAWKDGLIELNDADVPAVMRQIGRLYDVQIAYEGDKLPTWKSEGTVPCTLNLTDVLKVLDLNGIHCTLSGRIVTVHL